jgi:hypothetical protein
LRDGASRKPALVRRCRLSKKSDWGWIARLVDGVAVTAADVIILRKEFERYAASGCVRLQHSVQQHLVQRCSRPTGAPIVSQSNWP